MTISPSDHEMAAAVIALSTISGDRGLAAVNVERREIDWNRLDQAFSSGERVMCDVAFALWRSEGKVDLARVAALDPDWFDTVIAAMRARRGQVDVQRLNAVAARLDRLAAKRRQ